MSAQLPITDAESVSTDEPVVAPMRRAGSSPRAPLRQVAQYLLIALLAAASYFLVSHFFLQSVSVVGVSMVPTLQNADRYLLNRWVFHIRSPRPADIVVLRDPLDNGFSVKRIVAVGGDSVCLKQGAVFVNGKELEEPYLEPGTRTFAPSGLEEHSFQCAPGQYFVLGDNRNASVDSRVYGPVPRANILGLIIR